MRFFGTRRSSRLRGCLKLNAPITRMSRITPSTPATISATFTPFRRRDRSWVYMGMCEPRIVRLTRAREGSHRKRRDLVARLCIVCHISKGTCSPRHHSEMPHAVHVPAGSLRARRATRRAMPTNATRRFASPRRHPRACGPSTSTSTRFAKRVVDVSHALDRRVEEATASRRARVALASTIAAGVLALSPLSPIAAAPASPSRPSSRRPRRPQAPRRNRRRFPRPRRRPPRRRRGT